MRKNLRQSCIMESSVAILTISLGATTIFSGCSAKEDEKNVGTSVDEINKIDDLNLTANKISDIKDNTEKFEFKEVNPDVSKMTKASVKFMNDFDIYLDTESNPFIISGNQLVEMKNDGTGMYLPISDDNHIIIYNGQCGYLLYSKDEYSTETNKVTEFLQQEVSSTDATLVPVVINQDSNRIKMVNFQYVEVLSGNRSCFDLLSILDELQIEYEVQDNVIIVKRFNYETNTVNKVYIPLAKKGSLIRDTCSNGKTGTNVVLACTFEEDGVYYADRSTLYNVLGISIGEKYNGYIIYDNIGINLETAIAEPVMIPECNVIKEVVDTPTTKVTVVESGAPSVDNSNSDLQLSDEQIISANSDENEQLCRDWGIVAQFGYDQHDNAKLLAEKMNEKYSNYHFTVEGGGAVCDEYVEATQMNPEDVPSIEESLANIKAWLGDDWTAIKSKPFNELIDHVKYSLNFLDLSDSNIEDFYYMAEVHDYIVSRCMHSFKDIGYY